MNRKPPVPGKTLSGKDYWRSLEELAGTPEFQHHLEREFPDDRPADEVSRRSFLGLMGATFAMAGLVGCRRPLAKILPYSRMPEDLVPGVPQYYATSRPWRGGAEPLVVESHEGRPTKVAGNRLHPLHRTGGADEPGFSGTTHFAQAAVLALYDPDRSQGVLRDGADAAWADFEAWAATRFGAFAADGGRGLAFLGEVSSSPTLDALREEARRRFPEATWHVWEPVNRDNALEGARLAFGRTARAHVDYAQASVILALDADFLMSDPDSPRQARGFAKGRRLTSEKDSMNRLYAVENSFSITGATADHRLRLAASRIADFGAALAVKLAESQGMAMGGLDVAALRAAAAGAWSPAEVAWLDAVAKDLAAHRGRAVVVVGDRQPAALHALAHALNAALGSVGTVVRYTEETDPGNHAADLKALVERLNAGSVDTLVVFGANPVFAAPADLGFAAAMKKAKTVVHHGLYVDETGEAATWHLPAAHFLESWGDARTWDGTIGIVQPLIEPLYGGRSELEVLATLLGRDVTGGHEIVRAGHRDRVGFALLDASWNQALHDGFIPGSAFPELVLAVDAGSVSGAWRGRKPAASPTGASPEIVFVPAAGIYDGRFANSGPLQELPDPMTKLTWDNAAMVSPRTAHELGVTKEDVIELTAGGRTLRMPVWVLPGQADGSITVAFGYGRRRAGRVGTGVGRDVYAFRASDALHVVPTATVAKTGERYRLASTQDHFAMEGRPLVREASLEHYREHPEFAEHMEEAPEGVTLYTDREYNFDEGYQWGMVIDLGTCTGCNACVAACQSENNISTVGKDEILRGREMHWIRLDRYFIGEEEDPQAVTQPIPCMQCENAPCESVCPVNATSHSGEGLNDMVYNRCIGTRYCSNNCPYKVRRFNFFDWNKKMTEVEKMGKNPNVTVRMRGIMEKCTYCVQRINRARITAKIQKRSIRDGEIITACQEVCPTESIAFGNVNDPESAVSRLRAQNRNYAMLAWLNTKPRTTYLARVRNVNPDLEHHA